MDQDNQYHDSQDLLVIQQFHDLTRRATSYFASLREFPAHHKKRLWHPYFHKCFEMYSMLWRFQQEHRPVLLKAGVLKRWEIGEIASRIAQLYYHYYLRTSETRYLLESNVFYEAIVSREYFANVQTHESSTALNKKLRVYARFIVVCLLLNKRENVQRLLKQLREDVFIYKRQYRSPPDFGEWKMVIQELSSFLEADTAVQIGESVDNISYRTILSSPAGSTAHQPASPTGISQSLIIQEALIVCNRKKTIKFSEMTLDMFRMMQSLEHASIQNSKNSSRTRNPHKHILYRPDYREVLQSLSSAITELSDNGAILLYISADSFNDGIALRTIQESRETQDPNCLTIDDIMPFTRRPMLLIVDSDNGIAFKPTERSRYGEPFLLIHAVPAPQQTSERPVASAALLTHFLSNPLLAYCELFGTNAITEEHFEELSIAMTRAFNELKTELLSRELDASYRAFLRNPITASYILRFLFFYTVTKRRCGGDTTYCPQSYPPLPEDTYQVVEDILTSFIVQHLSQIADIAQQAK